MGIFALIQYLEDHSLIVSIVNPKTGNYGEFLFLVTHGAGYSRLPSVQILLVKGTTIKSVVCYHQFKFSQSFYPFDWCLSESSTGVYSLILLPEQHSCAVVQSFRHFTWSPPHIWMMDSLSRITLSLLFFFFQGLRICKLHPELFSLWQYQALSTKCSSWMQYVQGRFQCCATQNHAVRIFLTEMKNTLKKPVEILSFSSAIDSNHPFVRMQGMNEL